MREKDQYKIDDRFLNGYARFVGIHALGVYNSLCRHANREQTSWPSINTIAKELSIGRTSVIESIKRLEFFNIIQKKRIGKKATNRYLLISKHLWKTISEVCLKDFSEVCHTDFTSLRGKLHQSATRTSIVRNTHSKDTQRKESVSKKKKCALPGCKKYPDSYRVVSSGVECIDH